MLKFVTIMALMAISVGSHAQTNAELNEKINALADQIEDLKKKKSSDGVKFGGYGEITYSKSEEGEKDTVGGEPEFDNKRFILYINYDFTPKWSLVSEIEIEHADEVYMEQAYLNYAHSDALHLRAGTLLLPIGHINLYHEPTTFFGVQRPQVETRIIPATWRENGVGVYGKRNALSYHFYYVNALAADTGTGSSPKPVNASGVRNGRQKASKANAHKGAFIARVDYALGAQGEVGASVYSGGLSGASADVDHNIFELHYKGVFGPVHARALYTEATLSNTEELNAEISSDVAEKMNGYYLEVGYDVMHGRSELQVIPFVRHEVINTHAEVHESVTEDKSQDQTHQTFGVVVKPTPLISLKADYTKTTNEAETGTDSWNLGVGWNF